MTTLRSQTARTLYLNGIPRVRGVGEPRVPLNDDAPKAVAFVVGMRPNPVGSANMAQAAIGTAFFVWVPTSIDKEGWIYTVTARHVVEHETSTWLRVVKKDGTIDILPVPHWTLHPTADVAVAFVGRNDLAISWTQTEHFLDAWDRKPTLGDRVYFVGLLTIATSMVMQNVGMVRSGTLGRMYQDNVPLRDPIANTVSHHQMHLIDCRSFGGFSGSPCYAQFDAIRHVDEPAMPGGMIGDVISRETLLLGLLSGHFDDPAGLKPIEGTATDSIIANARFPMNTGIGIVTPVEKIRECLMDEELVMVRRARDEMLIEQKKQREYTLAATPDEGSVPIEGMTRGDFETALRKVSRRVEPSQPDERTTETSE